MNKERIQKMADTISNLKEVVSPAIMAFSLEEWDEIMQHLKDRHSKIQGGSIIIDAMGGNSQIKDLEAKFQCEMMEAIHSYAVYLHEANKISQKIQETKGNLEKNKGILQSMF